MTQILLADDHAVVRRGLRQILAETIPEASFGEAETAAEALSHLRSGEWDIAILDISLPGKSGLEALKEIKQLRPNLPVLILSVHPEEEFAVRALKAGASGYVTKKTASEELAQAVRKVLQGGKYVTPSLAERLAVEVGAGFERPRHERLSDREYQVFRLLALGETVKQIAVGLSLSVPTVSTYRARILEKMGMKGNADLTQYAFRNRILE